MTNIHPRRALAESEAAAWLDLHKDWASGLPAEVRDTSIKGELFHAHLGDGTDTLWWQSTASDLKKAEQKPTSTTPSCAVDSDYDQSLPTIERRTVQTNCVGNYGIASKPPVRVVARAGTEQLKQITPVLGQSVPGALTYDRRTDSKRRSGVVQTFSDTDRLGVDSTWMQQLAYDELVSWLRIQAKLTDKEVEALERRAAGQPVPDRHCLQRAQRKAIAAL
jgi:hypothetical protein